MLNKADFERIEDSAVNEFINTNSEEVEDYEMYDKLPHWDDADSYHLVNAECIIPSYVISSWLYDDFYDKIEQYLSSEGVKDISELASPEDLISEESYYNFCLDICQLSEDYWYEHYFDDLCEDYFYEHATEL